MKTRILLFGFSVLLLCFFSCKSNKQLTSDNSMNSIDWNGVYTGSLPCADCEGINTMIKLNKDLTYETETKYTGKSNEIYKSTGTFNWDNTGNKIILKNTNQNVGMIYYAVGENRLTQLDAEGNVINGDLANKY